MKLLRVALLHALLVTAGLSLGCRPYTGTSTVETTRRVVSGTSTVAATQQVDSGMNTVESTHRVVSPEPESVSTAIALTVDAAANRHAISPGIYGLNFAPAAFAAEIALPLRRWGGNAVTRYNWQGPFTNHAADWYFHNNDAGDADDWVQENIAAGALSLITLPLSGYVAKDGEQTTCGYSVAKYGAQDDVDDEDGYPNCGNGLKNGVPITTNDPLDTSIVVTQSFVAGWVTHLAGLPGNGAPRLYDLDNEPDIWFETHRDVRPVGWTYDEFRDRTYAYAAAIKAADPSAQLFGPVVNGWTYYFFGSYDGQREDWSSPDDQNAHGGTPFVTWYLQQMQAYQTAHGVRLLDYLDLHFYPQNGVALTTAGNAARQALRLRSTRALWDPTYVDESWIGSAGPDGGIVRLLPRMHDWVDDNYPGTKLAITEYNWGGLEHINGALTQAEVLGLFGREGLDAAALWNYGDSSLGYDHFQTLPGAYAFRLYRNYDGAGSQFGNTSVSALSANPAQLSIFAAERGGDGALTLMILNKTGGVLTGSVTLAGFTAGGPAEVYRYSAADLTHIVRQSDQAVCAGGFGAAFPANSITLVVIPSGPAPECVYLPLTSRP